MVEFDGIDGIDDIDEETATITITNINREVKLRRCFFKMNNKIIISCENLERTKRERDC
jgi:hypothetical protein